MPGPTRHLPPNESTNDRQVREPITGLWTPLNNVLAEFEGEFTGESHALLDAYGNASHLKLFLASLQISRAKIDQQAFEKKAVKSSGKEQETGQDIQTSDQGPETGCAGPRDGVCSAGSRRDDFRAFTGVQRARGYVERLCKTEHR